MMMSNFENRMLFLGDRSIASRAIKIFLDRYKSPTFKLLGVVSSDTFCAEHGMIQDAEVTCFSNTARNDDVLLEFIHANKINLLISVQHNWILSKKVLDAVGSRCFNLHNAKLPRYKGYNSISHAIYNDDKEYVSTVHWMDEKVDSGNIAYEELTIISETDTAKSLYTKTVEASVRAVIALYECLSRDETPPAKPLDYGEPSVFYARNSIDSLLEVFLNDPPELMNRKVRSSYYPPHNSAYINLNGLRVNLIPE